MDVRLLSLKQEQCMAFGRAVAAGFSSDNMTDLIAFSEYFGADRLRTACLNFLTVVQRRVMEPMKLKSELIINGDMPDFSGNLGTMSTHEASLESSLQWTHYSEAQILDAGHNIGNERIYVVHNGALPGSDNESGSNNLQHGKTGVTETRRRWGPAVNIRPELLGDQNELNVMLNVNPRKNHCQYIQGIPNTSNGSLTNVSVNVNIQGSTECQADGMLDNSRGQVLMFQGPFSFKNVEPPKVSSVNAMDELSPSRTSLLNRCAAVGESLSGHGDADNLGHSSSASKQTGNNLKPVSGHSKWKSEKNYPSEASTKVIPTRRFSVQDAISLFENKQRKESVETSKKQQIIKHDSASASSKCTDTESSSMGGTWSSGESEETSGFLFENLSSGEQGVGQAIMKKKDVTADLMPLQAETSNSMFEEHSLNSSDPEKHTLDQQPFESNGKKMFQIKHRRSIQQEAFLDKTPRDPLKNVSDSNRVPTNLDSGHYSSLIKGPGSLESKDKGPVEGGWYSAAFVPISTEGISGMNGSSMKVDASYNNQGMMIAPSEGIVAIGNEQNTKDATPLSVVSSQMTTAEITDRGSLDTSRVNSTEYDKHNRSEMQASETHDESSERVGRFYERYRELRDAKLKEVNEFKRAEREAKLRLMEETYLLRKAELDAQILDFSMRNYQQIRGKRLQARKDDLQILQREKDEAMQKRSKETSIQLQAHSNSPSSMSLEGRDEAPGYTSLNSKRPAVVSQKGAFPPRNSIKRTLPLPKSTSENVASPAMNPRRSSVSFVNDNILAKSVTTVDVRKENAKPNPRHMSNFAASEAKDGSSGCFWAVNEARPLKANGNLMDCTYTGDLVAKDKVNPLSRKNQPGSRNILASDDVMISLTLKHENEEPSELKMNSKRATNTPLRDSNRPDDIGRRFPEIDGKDVEMSTREKSTDLIDGTPKTGGSCGPQMLHGIPCFPADMEGHQQPVHDVIPEKSQESGRNHRSQSEDSSENMHVTASCQASSLPNEHGFVVSNSFSLSDSRIGQVIGTVSDHFNPSLCGRFESHSLTPYTDPSQTPYANEQCKLVAVASTKEPAKGLKKLLKFGRKSRASDATSAVDSTSPFTMEGDDESEPQRFSIDMHNIRARLDERRVNDIMEEQCIFLDKTSGGQSLKSSIPTAPPNFRPRDDHLIGGTMLKAPKSLFSLSFRTKGTEGRA
ncbi:hypothetical protein KP509_36G065200 [Ceratopteris richardii]|nr:hypothetical protein KP509_36G065200 [Ceratopteris richardii]